jgi:hypothetical protein
MVGGPPPNESAEADGVKKRQAANPHIAAITMLRFGCDMRTPLNQVGEIPLHDMHAGQEGWRNLSAFLNELVATTV